MDSLPMLPPSCSLDAAGAAEQLDRYRRIGAGAELVADEPRLFTLRLADGVDPSVVEAAIATEAECCSFFEIDFEPAQGRLSVAVMSAEHVPALGAIRDALGLAAQPT